MCFLGFSCSNFWNVFSFPSSKRRISEGSQLFGQTCSVFRMKSAVRFVWIGASSRLRRRRSASCCRPEAGSSAWRRAGGGAVVGWTWFWSDTPTWSTASRRKEPSLEHFLLVVSPCSSTEWFSICAESLWPNWISWTPCQRLKWVWLTRWTENPFRASQVSSSCYSKGLPGSFRHPLLSFVKSIICF